MVAVNLGEPVDRVRAYVTELKLTFPVVIDSAGELAGAYDARFTPTHFLIDRAGIVRAGGAGGRDWNSPLAHAAAGRLLEPGPARSKN